MTEYEKDFFNTPPKEERGSWRGVPGLTEYEHVQYIRKDRIDRWLGPDGAAVITEEFDWNKSFAPVIEQLRRVKEKELIDLKTQEAERLGVDPSDIISKADIAKQVNEEIAEMFDDVNVLYNTLNKYRDRLSIITGKIPDEFQKIAGVTGADNYFLVQGGTREENEKQIFDNFKSLNNVGGNTRFDPIYGNSGGVIEGHSDRDFFGWKLLVDNCEFVFIWNPDENEKPEEDQNEEKSEDNPTSEQTETEPKE